jgi:hypothetical protein
METTDKIHPMSKEIESLESIIKGLEIKQQMFYTEFNSKMIETAKFKLNALKSNETILK